MKRNLWWFRGLPSAFLIVTIVAPLSTAEATPIGTGRYSKHFIVPNVAPNAEIWAGAQVQTWGGADFPKDDTIRIKNAVPQNGAQKPVPAVRYGYLHATDNIATMVARTGDAAGKPQRPNIEFPIASTGRTVARGYSGRAGILDKETEENATGATVDVEKINMNQLVINTNQGPQIINNSVSGEFLGAAIAGVPEDPDIHKWHSADSVAAVEIAGAQEAYVCANTGCQKRYEYLAKTTIFGGTFAVAGPAAQGAPAKYQDPVWLTVNDLDTGVITRELLMSLEIDLFRATVQIDDQGILFSILATDSASFVSLNFSSALSPWVLNPYTYGATLDVNGLSAFGLTPLPDWQVTTTGDTINAFFPFGIGGQPFDYINVLPDDSVFTVGHSYNYDVGDGALIYALASSSVVPEASSLLLLSTGLLGLVGVGWRQRKQAAAAQRSVACENLSL